MQVNMEAAHQQMQTSLGYQGVAAAQRQTPVTIPPGYVMLPSGVLVPIEALQDNHFAASFGMLQQPQTQVIVPPHVGCGLSAAVPATVACEPGHQ